MKNKLNANTLYSQYKINEAIVNCFTGEYGIIKEIAKSYAIVSYDGSYLLDKQEYSCFKKTNLPL